MIPGLLTGGPLGLNLAGMTLGDVANLTPDDAYLYFPTSKQYIRK